MSNWSGEEGKENLREDWGEVNRKKVLNGLRKGEKKKKRVCEKRERERESEGGREEKGERPQLKEERKCIGHCMDGGYSRCNWPGQYGQAFTQVRRGGPVSMIPVSYDSYRLRHRAVPNAPPRY